MLRQTEAAAGFTAYHRHLKRAKRRAMEIPHLAPAQAARRRTCYRDLLQLTEATATYATCALAQLECLPSPPARDRLRTQLTTLLPRFAQVIDQTTRRVLQGDAVPADEKLVSLFEAHADVLRKDRRDTYDGHNIFLTTGRSGLILDCAIPKGNPADSTWTVPLVRRQQQRFGQAPRQVTFDGAFASQDNLAAVKALGVTDVCFAKTRGLAVLAMVRSQWVYDKLRRFRAGIEAGISLFKRVFGLARCVWKGARLSRVRAHGRPRGESPRARARPPHLTTRPPTHPPRTAPTDGVARPSVSPRTSHHAVVARDACPVSLPLANGPHLNHFRGLTSPSSVANTAFQDGDSLMAERPSG